MSTRPFPKGRIGLKQLLADAAIAKPTFFARYRYDPVYVELLDIDEDRDHRLHFPADAGMRLKALRNKAPHGNKGRGPQRVCPQCTQVLPTRYVACDQCGAVFDQRPGSEQSSPRRRTAEVNFTRREELERLKRAARGGTDGQ